jgi:hypothetical protein
MIKNTIEERIEDLRDKLYIILENEEYSLEKILKASQELDELIVQYMRE